MNATTGSFEVDAGEGVRYRVARTTSPDREIQVFFSAGDMMQYKPDELFAQCMREQARAPEEHHWEAEVIRQLGWQADYERYSAAKQR